MSEIISIPVAVIYVARHARLRFQKYEKHIIVWLAFSAISAVIGLISFNYNLRAFISGLFYIIRIIILIITLHFISDAFSENAISTDKIINYILKCYLLVCLIGFLQLFIFPVAYDWYHLFWSIGTTQYRVDPHVNRLLSTYMDPNYLAACLIIPFTISLTQWQDGRKGRVPLIFIYALSIILTVSRSGFLGLAFACAFAFLKPHMTKRNFLSDIVMLAVLLVAVAVLVLKNAAVIMRIVNSVSDPSTGARFDSWRYSFRIFTHSPVFGIGYNMFDAFSQSVLSTREVYFEDGADSSILLIMLSSGTIGTVYFISAVLKNTIKAIKGKRYKSFQNITIVFFTSLVLCNFNNLLFYVIWLFPMMLVSNVYLDEYNNRRVLCQEAVFEVPAVGNELYATQ